MRPKLSWAALMLALGCAGDKPPDSDPGSDSSTDSSAATSPCASGSWPEGLSAASIQVRADGDDSGDGSVDSPVATLARALELVVEGGPLEVLVGPGSFGAQVDLFSTSGGATPYDGLRLSGCSADETTLTPEDESDPEYAYVLRTDHVNGLTLSDVTVQGGTRPLWIWQGSGASSPIVLRDLVVQDARVTGILCDGVDTTLTLDGVVVRRTSPGRTFGSGGDIGGYGISINGASATLTDVSVEASTGIGLMVDGAGEENADGSPRLSISGLQVRDTVSNANGQFGRGVNIQDLGVVEVTDVTATNNADAGFFAAKVLRLSITDLQVDTVSSALTPDGEATGDGLVITAFDDVEADPAPSLYQVTLGGSAVTAAGRAGMLFERTQVTLDGTNTAEGSDWGIAYQDGAVLQDAEGGTPSEEITELEDTLELNYYGEAWSDWGL